MDAALSLLGAKVPSPETPPAPTPAPALPVPALPVATTGPGTACCLPVRDSCRVCVASMDGLPPAPLPVLSGDDTYCEASLPADDCWAMEEAVSAGGVVVLCKLPAVETARSGAGVTTAVDVTADAATGVNDDDDIAAGDAADRAGEHTVAAAVVDSTTVDGGTVSAKR